MADNIRGKKPELQDFYLVLTKECNHLCTFCSIPKEHMSISFENAKKLIAAYQKKGFKRFVLTGGEPTLYAKLPKLITYATKRGLEVRIVTNAVKCANIWYVKKLVNAGLKHAVVSLHAYTAKQHKEIIKINDFEVVLKGIRNLLDAHIKVDLNTTVIVKNYKHLLEFYKFVIFHFPEIKHYGLNYIECEGRAKLNKKVTPKISDAEIYLRKAMQFLLANNKTFRVERLPLCYMSGFAEYCTETLRILGNQQFYTYFWGEKHLHIAGKGGDFISFYTKSDACKACTHAPVCVGLKNNYVDLYGLNELYPLFTSPKNLLSKRIKD